MKACFCNICYKDVTNTGWRSSICLKFPFVPFGQSTAKPLTKLCQPLGKVLPRCWQARATLLAIVCHLVGKVVPRHRKCLATESLDNQDLLKSR